MGLLKTALIGAAVYGAVRYLTKKDALGQSKFDEIKEQIPDWVEKAKVSLNEMQTENFPKT